MQIILMKIEITVCKSIQIWHMLWMLLSAWSSGLILVGMTSLPSSVLMLKRNAKFLVRFLTIKELSMELQSQDKVSKVTELILTGAAKFTWVTLHGSPHIWKVAYDSMKMTE